MNLVKVGGPAVYLRCVVCGKRQLTGRDVVFADLDGRPFEDYYCANDAPEGR